MLAQDDDHEMTPGEQLEAGLALALCWLVYAITIACWLVG